MNHSLIKTSHNTSPVQYLISLHQLSHSRFILLLLKLLQSLVDTLAEEPVQARSGVVVEGGDTCLVEHLRDSIDSAWEMTSVAFFKTKDH